MAKTLSLRSILNFIVHFIIAIIIIFITSTPAEWLYVVHNDYVENYKSGSLFIPFERENNIFLISDVKWLCVFFLNKLDLHCSGFTINNNDGNFFFNNN